MKLKERDRSQVYDQLYALAAKVLTRMNACATCPVSCKKDLFHHHYSKSWCCGGCPNLGPTGCTVQALGCKLWICPAEKRRQNPIWKSRLRKLAEIADHYGIHMARATKEESLRFGQTHDFWYIYNIQHGYRT